MKTTLVIDDHVMRRIKEEAARTGSTISDLVEAALRRYLMEPPEDPPELPPLPVFDGGVPLIDILDRDLLYEVMDAERDRRLYGSAEGVDDEDGA